MAPLFLGIVPSIALVTGLINRTEVPAITPGQPVLPRFLNSDLGDTVTLRAIWQGLDWQVGQIEHGGANTLVVSHPSRRPQADLLLYWVPDGGEYRPTPEPVDLQARPAEGRQLPAEALFLGPLDGEITSAFELPVQATGRPGTLAVYSLPYRRVAAVSENLTLH